MTGLSRIKWLFVIARNSSFVYKGQSRRHAASRARARRPLCAGRRRSQGGRPPAHYRATCRSRNRSALWADKYDGALEDIFDLQDKSPSRVVGIVEPSVRNAPKSNVRAESVPKTSTPTISFLRACPTCRRGCPSGGANRHPPLGGSAQARPGLRGCARPSRLVPRVVLHSRRA